jgi:type IX secretion system PorP/SprF family membrane protein
MPESMRKFIAIALAVIATLGQARAQQRPQYTQYVLNNYLINPAVVGIESYTDLKTSYRSQWLGVEGAPKTFYATIHGSIGNYSSRTIKKTKPSWNGFARKNSYKKARPHHGLGAVVQSDKAGLLQASTLNGSYAYHLPLTGYFILSTGISAGITQLSVDLAAAHPIQAYDPYLNGTKLSRTKLDLGLGLWLYSPDFYIGISGAQLIKSKADVDNGEAPNLGLLPHFYTMAGMRLQPNRDLTLIPSVMTKITPTVSPTIDLNFRALYNQQVWAGLSYRLKDAWAAMAGINLNHLIDVGYSYEIPTSSMNQISVGSHEVILGLKLNNRKKIICPQWLW